MRSLLQRHPDHPCDAVASIAVEAARTPAGLLTLGYLIDGELERIFLPPVGAPVRADELWRRTCFEAFVRPEGAEAYFEFNFSPSGAWATYGFDRYRVHMRAPVEAAQPRLLGRSTPGGYALEVAVDLSPLKALSLGARWDVGLSAVIEETNGRRSFWALTHPPGQADFHNAAGFSLSLGPEEFA
jgi:hypothetical protein